MSSSASASPLRQILELRISQLSAEMEGLFAEARERGRRESADQLNQAVRRIRQSADIEELRAILLDTASAFSTGAALFRIEGQAAIGERIRGVPEEAAETFRGLEVPLASAAALSGAVESRDPVIAVSSEGEVSTEMVRLAGHRPDGRVSIFPVVVRERVPALVYAWGTAQGSALELLSQVAAAVWSEISVPPAPAAPPELVHIEPAPAPAPAPAPPASAWEQLPPGEQEIHLRAQRFARVRAAELRLDQVDAVQWGRTRHDIYGALREPIDAARAAFRKSFFAPCASMVDYLHLELLRTLANDDAELLGRDYPGPMA
ncbi:conserved hypothetical protein [Candidatus Sulfopaludibacter sp. SbA4]|nr:conserved hypothetical protein [Candidatus Sulfopaludibacter sp. SbA4]